jgi:hypothetical protein
LQFLGFHDVGDFLAGLMCHLERVKPPPPAPPSDSAAAAHAAARAGSSPAGTGTPGTPGEPHTIARLVKVGAVQLLNSVYPQLEAAWFPTI